MLRGRDAFCSHVHERTRERDLTDFPFYDIVTPWMSEHLFATDLEIREVSYFKYGLKTSQHLNMYFKTLQWFYSLIGQDKLVSVCSRTWFTKGEKPLTRTERLIFSCTNQALFFTGNSRPLGAAIFPKLFLNTHMLSHPPIRYQLRAGKNQQLHQMAEEIRQRIEALRKENHQQRQWLEVRFFRSNNINTNWSDPTPYSRLSKGVRSTEEIRHVNHGFHWCLPKKRRTVRQRLAKTPTYPFNGSPSMV